MNAIGQRSELIRSSDIPVASSSILTWGYDSLGQVVSADSTIPGLDRSYQFDLIGNRLRAATGSIDVNDPTATVYTPNALNQYSQITHNALTNNPEYDSDGNATAYPLPANATANSMLTWDAENRLISTTVNGTTTTYQYDAQSRRVAIWSAGLQPASSPPTTTFVYDGWNPIAKYNSSYTLAKTYTWGIDLSDSMQGAGGVGGLLSVSLITNNPITSNIYYPTYDGNGNVSEYLDSTGAIVAHYEYDPFGKTTIATGPIAADFSHRFSTKPLDAETGLYYYGYRYYDPETGRWPSRDPIGERGGMNLYGFVGNDGIGQQDYLGEFVMPSYFHDNVVASVFKNRVSKSAYRSTGRSLATWDADTCYCTVRYESKIDDGTVDVVTDIYYYNPPPSFGEAIVENILKKLIDLGAGNLAERNAYASAVYNGSQVIYDSIQQSSVPRPQIDDNTLLLSEENERYENFFETTSGAWKLTSTDVLSDLTQSSCEALSEQEDPVITIQ